MQEKAGGRIEQLRENVDRGEVVRQIDIGKGSGGDASRDQKGKNDPYAQKTVAPAGFAVALMGKSPFAAGTQDGQRGRHRDKYTIKPEERRKRS